MQSSDGVSALLTQTAEANSLSISLEVFVPSALPSCLPSMRSLLSRLSRMEPLFLDIVCGGGVDSALRALDLATYAITECGSSPCLHLSASDFGEEAGVRAVLARARQAGVCSLVVELGAGPHRHFPSTAHLVALVKAAEPSLCVGCVGFPPDCRGEAGGSFEEGIASLAACAAAGAEFVLAQHTFSVASLLRLVLAVKEARLCLPVIPSIPLLTSRECYSALAAATGARLAPEEEARLTACADRRAFRAAAQALAVALCRDLLASGAVDAFHFITLNAEHGLHAVLEELGLYKAREGAGSRRKLPWRLAPVPARKGEDVRPLFWCNRTASYLERTAGWAMFPSGRWGGAALSSSSSSSSSSGSSGSAGEPSSALGAAYAAAAPVSPLPPLHSARQAVGGRVFGACSADVLLSNAGTVEERRQMWGQNPTTQEDVWRVFRAYVEGKIARLPWCSMGGIASETGSIGGKLVALNSGGFLTINSQPGVAGVKRHLAALIKVLAEGGRLRGSSSSSSSSGGGSGSPPARDGEGYPSITYHAVDAGGTWLTNSAVRDSINTVTWGVFSDREIQTPTVMDPASFVGAWREEAFELWTAAWASIYPAGEEAHTLLCDIAESYYMVCAVDNNFTGGCGGLFPAFFEALEALAASKGRGGEADPKSYAIVLEQQKAAQAAQARMAKLKNGAAL